MSNLDCYNLDFRQIVKNIVLCEIMSFWAQICFENLIRIKENLNILVCFRCDGKGQYKNQFGIMEKCESCQKMSMSFEKAATESDLDEEGY